MNFSANVYSSSTASVLASRQKKLQAVYGNLDMKSLAFSLSNGRQEEVVNRIGQELGINSSPVDNNLSFSRYVTAANDSDNLMFQGTNGYLYDINFSSGKVSAIDEKSWIDENYQGLINPKDDSDRNYDVIDFGQNSAEIINYSFTGTGDGCDKISTDAFNFASSSTVSKWGSNIQWVYQEVDLKSPSLSFINNVERNSSQYINKNDANDIILKLGYEKYINELVIKAALAMSANDNSGFSIADYFKEQAEASAKADAEQIEQKETEEQAKADAAAKEEKDNIEQDVE